jgi:hypothetical protein
VFQHGASAGGFSASTGCDDRRRPALAGAGGVVRAESGTGPVATGLQLWSHFPTLPETALTHHESTPQDDTFYGSDFGALQAFDPDIAGVLLSELGRIRGGLQLIASENMSSPEVLTALGSTLSNKYAEGYPGRRYYGGCA